jgi:hypothetical protein
MIGTAVGGLAVEVVASVVGGTVCHEPLPQASDAGRIPTAVARRFELVPVHLVVTATWNVNPKEATSGERCASNILDQRSAQTSRLLTGERKS